MSKRNEAMAKLNPRTLAIVVAMIWAGAVLFVGIINLNAPSYGKEFLELLGSIYPGYAPEQNIKSIVVGTGYALIDGGVCGWLVAWLYNRLSK